MLPTATTTYFTPRVARTKTSHNSHLAAIVAASQNIRVVRHTHTLKQTIQQRREIWTTTPKYSITATEIDYSTTTQALTALYERLKIRPLDFENPDPDFWKSATQNPHFGFENPTPGFWESRPWILVVFLYFSNKIDKIRPLDFRQNPPPGFWKSNTHVLKIQHLKIPPGFWKSDPWILSISTTRFKHLEQQPPEHQQHAP